MSDVSLTGWMLVAGAILFGIGAGNPSLARAWTAPQAEFLAVVARHPGAWRFTGIFMIAGTVVTAAGIAALPALLPAGWGQTLGTGAASAFGIAAVLWVISLLYRQAVVPSTAETFSETGAVDLESVPLERLSGALFHGFIVVGALAIAALGIAETAGGPVGAPVGLACAALGALFVGGLLAFGDMPPFTIYIPTLAMGIALLVTR